MFRSFLSGGIPLNPARRFNSTLAQLSQAIKNTKSSKDLKASTNSSVVSDVDHLLLGSKLGSSSASSTSTATATAAGRSGFGSGSSAAASSMFSFKSTDYLLQQTLRHPREVAKSIRIFGPQAGRTFDVRHGNIGATLGSVQTILRTNKIRQLKRVQARHIRPAKYQKQKHREWWKRNFSVGFKDLMAQVRDAKRRGY